MLPEARVRATVAVTYPSREAFDTVMSRDLSEYIEDGPRSMRQLARMSPRQGPEQHAVILYSMKSVVTEPAEGGFRFKMGGEPCEGSSPFCRYLISGVSTLDTHGNVKLEVDGDMK